MTDATNLANLKARRDAIYAELAAIDTTKAGGAPNVNGAGSAVDHVGYKDGLYRELDKLNDLIASLEGPFEVVSEATS